MPLALLQRGKRILFQGNFFLAKELSIQSFGLGLTSNQIGRCRLNQSCIAFLRSALDDRDVV